MFVIFISEEKAKKRMLFSGGKRSSQEIKISSIGSVIEFGRIGSDFKGK
jgi:hypothetical protein